MNSSIVKEARFLWRRASLGLIFFYICEMTFHHSFAIEVIFLGSNIGYPFYLENSFDTECSMTRYYHISLEILCDMVGS